MPKRPILKYNISPDRKTGYYLISNFENKFVINLCTRLKLFWYQLVGFNKM
jgi:hypothetical protein